MTSPRARRHRRRVRIPVALAVLAIGSGALGVRLGSDGGAATARGSVAAPATPVLSPRRIAAWLSEPIADAKLRAELDVIVAASPPATCLTVSVGGREVYARNPDMALIPASNQKLVTATAAIEVLGADTRYRTKVVAPGAGAGAGAGAAPVGTIQGDLFLVGGGDPLLETKAYVAHFLRQPQIATPMESLADAIAKAGIRRITGRIVGDGSRYDSRRYPATWAQRFVDERQIGPLSALGVNDAFTAFPAKQSALESQDIPALVPAADPAQHAASVLTELLANRGIQVDGPPAAGTAPAGGRQIAYVDSPPMREVVKEMLDESDDQTAELLVKEMGYRASGQGSTEAGVRVVTRTMERLGLADKGTKAADGSGLGDANRTSCRLVSRILDRAGPRGIIGGSLAVAGKSGTLTDRFQSSKAKGRLRAKTGTLNEVTALSGFVDAVQGAVLTFSYIANGRTVSDEFVKLQEALGDDLVVYPEGPPLRLLEPKAK
ncbi:MAG: D-alanyl-D-alanine carboxypeptidase/D-alanyl-D-alanine-endopeptidase [Actinobacteria bacterium]|nr:D-alanyl-D-alanine carboxypeptidase/D-alanyl-D-alanine-endopeptidase [Actinomycetota bacterium]